MRRITRRVAILAASIATVALAAFALVITQTSLVSSSPVVAGAKGVMLTITGASIGSDLKPVVNFTLADGKGNPLRLSDTDSGGLRFLIAAIKTDPDTKNTKYVNYIVNTVAGRDYQSDGSTVKPALANAPQAAVDNGGTVTDLGSGKFSYKFAAAAPTDFNPAETHALVGYVTRDARASVSNDAFYFVPNGSPVTTQREVVKLENCNGCHDDLAAHGGTRRDTRICVVCHTSQTTDPESGNNVDFKVLIHKLHSGRNLPSVQSGDKYFIVGFGQNKIDFSEGAWPQDTRNCQTCHAGAAQGTNFKTQPSVEACGSCHDNVNFTTGQNHPGGPQNNGSCAACHPADGGEFDASVSGAHIIPGKSKQLRGVNFEIVSFTNTKPGQSPTVVFNIKDNAGQPILPSQMSSLSLILAGPTSDYTSAVSEPATGATPTGDGNFSYTFKATIPADAKGTFAVGTQGGLSTPLKDAFGNAAKNRAGQPIVASDFGFNKVAYGAVTDPVPMPRKQVVDIKNCNVCHDTLALHGGSRRNADFCVFCHNPVNTDATKRATANGPLPPESVEFDRLIHRIHTGEEQQDKPFVIYGGGANNIRPINLSEAVFPTDRRNCTKCHVPGSNLLSFIRFNRLPMTVKVGDTVVTQVPPQQTACMSCHDGAAAKAHAETNTASGLREACAVCHNEDRDFAVSKVHAQ